MASFIGYHGTDERGAQKIETDGFEDSSPDNWLGAGIYFFETQPGFEGLEAAEWWAKTHKNYPKWVILKAEIVSDKVFDMFASRGCQLAFGKLKRQFLDQHIGAGQDASSFNTKPVFMYLNRKFEVIRCLVDASRIDKFVNYVVGYPQIQICVSKSSCIRSFCKEKAWS